MQHTVAYYVAFQAFYRGEKSGWQLTAGSLLALVGVGLVIFNGNFVLKLSPLGDFLSLAASLSWAFYSLIMRQMSGRYSTVFVTRKVFFYGLLTILPVLPFVRGSFLCRRLPILPSG